MADYGVLPTGFNRKPLSVILAEIEEDFVTLLGPDVIQTSQSPLGQINGLIANKVSQLWEHAEDTYQSIDPDQAEGLRLEMLGRLRLLERATDEDDASFRQAITNADRARIDLQDLIRAVTNVSGVTYVQVFVNETDTTDADGLEPHSVSVAVLGGADADIALAIRTYVVPGIGTSGNTRVDTNSDGVCRTIWITRPAAVDISLDIEVVRTADKLGCPPAALATIAEGLLADLQGSRRPINGQVITEHLIRSAIESRYANVEVTSVTGMRLDDTGSSVPIAIDFDEIAAFDIENITITNAS